LARAPLEIWALDCETDPFKKGRDNPRPFLWGAYCRALNRYETFGFGSQVLDFFRERRCSVYAHNGGRFDFHYLREGFESEQQLLIINGRIAKFRVGKAEYRDSFSLLPVPLSAYQKEKVDYSLFEPEVRDLPENKAMIEKYLKSDCVNLAELLYEFVSRFGRPLSMAGCAMAYYIRQYRGGVKPRQTAAQFERYKPYFFGGRVECFKAGYGVQDFKVVDKNSAYPHAMLSEHPLSPLADVLSDIPSDIEKCLIALTGVSDGSLPYRGQDNSLIFPRDKQEREYFVTGWEVKKALELKLLKITRINQVHYFDQTQNFRGYIEHFYNERMAARKRGDKAMDLFTKLFMNSCYGKFASDPSKYHDFMLIAPERLDAMAFKGWKPYMLWGDGRWLCYQPQPVERHWYYNIATAASITGYVRAGLLEDLNHAHGLLYCDTDSISAQSIDRLAMGSKLGEWKLELECDEYAIAGKKTYAFRSALDQQWNEKEKLYEYPKGAYKIACKGVDLNASEIIRASKGETVLYEPEVPTYSITRPRPVLINRTVSLTARVQHA
jgi:DNA polymerase type B, organellar and viral